MFGRRNFCNCSCYRLSQQDWDGKLLLKMSKLPESRIWIFFFKNFVKLNGDLYCLTRMSTNLNDFFFRLSWHFQIFFLISCPKLVGTPGIYAHSAKNSLKNASLYDFYRNIKNMTFSCYFRTLWQSTRALHLTDHFIEIVATLLLLSLL